MNRLALPLATLLLLAGCASTQPSETARAPEPSPSLHPLRSGVWVHASHRETEGFGSVLSNGLVVASDGEALLVNTAWGENPDASTEAVLHEVRLVAGAAVRGAVFTHYHDDSVAGIGALQRESIPTYATELTSRLMESEGWEAPDSLLADDEADVWVLHVGSREIEVFFPGPGHTTDNVVVYVPDARVLFGGCLIRPGESGSLGNTSDADVEAWAESVARVRARYGGRVEVVVPTHGAPGGPELLGHTIRLVEEYRERPRGR